MPRSSHGRHQGAGRRIDGGRGPTLRHVQRLGLEVAAVIRSGGAAAAAARQRWPHAGGRVGLLVVADGRLTVRRNLATQPFYERVVRVVLVAA
jgi:hypothetical protein